MLLANQQSLDRLNNKYFLTLILILWFNASFKECYAQVSLDPSAQIRQENLESCHVPTGGATFCVPLNRCHELTVLFMSLQLPIDGIPRDVAKYIKDSFACKTRNSVCCPFKSIINPKPVNPPSIEDRGKQI